MTEARFQNFVRRVANWTDAEVRRVSPAQVRHVAQVVTGGADPIYPPFGDTDLPADNSYVIWSIYHGLWWGKDRRGYTRHIERAGRYSREEAIEIARTRAGGWPSEGNPGEIAILERDAVEQVSLGPRYAVPV